MININSESLDIFSLLIACDATSLSLVTFYPRFLQQKRDERRDGANARQVEHTSGLICSADVTSNAHPEAINMPLQRHTRTHALLRSRRTKCDVLLSHKGQSRDNYGARETPPEKENIYATAREGGIFYIGNTRAAVVMFIS